jgi:hypothetical protein
MFEPYGRVTPIFLIESGQSFRLHLFTKYAVSSRNAAFDKTGASFNSKLVNVSLILLYF